MILEVHLLHPRVSHAILMLPGIPGQQGKGNQEKGIYEALRA
jgi:hypothetical protein